MKLQEWLEQNQPSDKMYWRDSFWDQIMFVRNALFGAMAENRDQQIEVVGTHTSKSIKLPVYHFKNSKYEVWFRNNFYDWSFTVNCEHPVDYEFCGVLMKDDPGGGCGFEGMDKFRNPWYQPRQAMTKFSSITFSSYDFYLVMMTLRHAFGIKYTVKP